jgi:hypothetical protein
MPSAEIVLVNPDGDKYAISDDGIVITHDRLHQKGHDGGLFSVSGHQDLGSGAAYMFLIQVNGIPVHVIVTTNAKDETDMDIYEGPTYDPAGTSVTAVNHKRASANTLNATITHTPTVSDDGTQILQKVLVAGQKQGGEALPGSEFILAPNTDYLIRFTSRAASNVVAYQLLMYEEDV